jgi:hypothetical protein
VPQDVFLVIFGEYIMEHVAFHTNLCAMQKEKPFKPVTKDKINMFLCINILKEYNDHAFTMIIGLHIRNCKSKVKQSRYMP